MSRANDNDLESPFTTDLEFLGEAERDETELFEESVFGEAPINEAQAAGEEGVLPWGGEGEGVSDDVGEATYVAHLTTDLTFLGSKQSLYVPNEPGEGRDDPAGPSVGFGNAGDDEPPSLGVAGRPWRGGITGGLSMEDIGSDRELRSPFLDLATVAGGLGSSGPAYWESGGSLSGIASPDGDVWDPDETETEESEAQASELNEVPTWEWIAEDEAGGLEADSWERHHADVIQGRSQEPETSEMEPVVADEWAPTQLQETFPELDAEFFLGRVTETIAVTMAIAKGERSENELTNLVFLRRYPNRDGRPLSRDESGFAELAEEWRQIRDTIVRPMLSRLPGLTSTASDTDRAEYAALQGRIATRDGKSRITSLNDYLAERDVFFGSRAGYVAAAVAADAEFDAMNQPNRRRIGQSESGGRPETVETKRALYRWLFKAYVDSGVSDPPSLITAGMTAATERRMASVRARHGSLRLGGFVARPMKAAGIGGYRLGTLSKHATGEAVDVVPQSANPHFRPADWAFVERVVGINVVRSVDRWRSDPAGLWREIRDLNAAYVQWLRGRTAEVQARRRSVGLPTTEAQAYTEVLKGRKTLLTVARRHGANHGFFNLAEGLVLDFARQSFLWGATFSGAPDLHHFEI